MGRSGVSYGLRLEDSVGEFNVGVN
jgi:hypothetical protein